MVVVTSYIHINGHVIVCEREREKRKIKREFEGERERKSERVKQVSYRVKSFTSFLSVI